VLKLLHPFMPFVTEEIYQRVSLDKGSIMVSPFPTEAGALADEKAVSDVTLLQNIVTAVRNIRGEVNLAPSKKLRVLALVPEEKDRAMIRSAVPYLVELANLDSLELAGEIGEEPKQVATGVAGSVKVHVFLEVMIDFSVEKSRLEKEIAKIARDLQVVSRKLANRDFREKASSEIVEKEETKFQTLREKNQILERALNRLGEWEKSGK